MLRRCFFAEWIKLRHSHMWIVLMILPMVSVLIGCANYSMNRAVLQEKWYSLWSQVGLFYGEFFFPVLIAICCAYMCRLEHFNINWNIVMTAPVPASGIFFAKLMVTGAMLCFVQIFFFLLYFCGGKCMGLTAAIPGEIPGWLLRGWIAALTISSLQLALSMHIRSFAVPVGIGLCAAFIGLGMYVMHLGMFFPHSLLTIGMGVLSQTGLSSTGSSILFVAVNGLYITVISGTAIQRMKRKDVIS